jgi:predicted RNA methylase
MSKYYIEKFDKTKIPNDFHKEFDTSKDGLAELWSYMFHTYAYTKQINKPNVFKVMINRRDQLSLHTLKQLKVAKEDSFDLFKQMPSYEYKEEFKETVFDETVLKDSDRVNVIDYRKLKASSNSSFSSLLPKHIKQVERVFNEWFDVSDSSTIVDATAHIGVDSIHFATMFKNATIESYEIDKNVAGLLNKNVKTFSLSDRIHVHPMNFLQSELPDNILYVYIDAPWGGRDYKKIDMDSFELFLGKYNIKEIAKRLLLSQKTKSVVLKVPRNYRFSDLSFHVERKDIKDGTKVSYVLLKLTLSDETRDKYLIKTLAIQSFLCIFDTLKAFKPSFVLDKNSIKFAFHLLYLKDGTISLKEDVNSLFYEELVTPYLDTSDPMMVNQLVSLSSILKQCVDHIVQSISVINKNDVISRLLLFYSSKQIKYKDSLKSDDDNEALFVPEEEKEEEDVERVDGLSDLDELNIDNDVDVDDVGEESGEERGSNEVEDETGEYDFDEVFSDDE